MPSEFATLGAADLAEQVSAPELARLDSARERRDVDVGRKQAVQTLGKLLGDLSGTADKMRNPATFRQLIAESSDSNVLDATVTGLAQEGSYEFEISSLARTHKTLADGFPDKDVTPVGFGFMTIESGGRQHSLAIEPGSNLSEVAHKINDSTPEVRATIINTGEVEVPYRLMVSSVKQGEEAKIYVDPDTTFLNFQTQASGRDLQAKFEGVDVKRPDNVLDQLVEGLNLKARSAAPGQLIGVTVRPDSDSTADGVREFVRQYNEVQSFGRKQNQRGDISGQTGPMLGDSSLRQVSRSLQSVVQSPELLGLGITTDPKTGQMQIDESKLKMALTNDYEGVINTFASRGADVGLAEKLSRTIKSLQDRNSGAVGARLKGLDDRIRRQDQEIEKKEQQLQIQKSRLSTRFATMNSRISAINSQGDILAQRFGGAQSQTQSMPQITNTKE